MGCDFPQLDSNIWPRKDVEARRLEGQENYLAFQLPGITASKLPGLLAFTVPTTVF
jgi:hypothetical protein